MPPDEVKPPPPAALPPAEGDFKRVNDRLDATEKENAALKERLAKLEAKEATDDEDDEDDWLRKATR